MKTTPLADGSVPAKIHPEGLLSLIETLYTRFVDNINNPDGLRAVRETAKDLFASVIIGELSPITHPDCPSLLKELDARRGRLYVPRRRPRRYSDGTTAEAYESAYEAGFRGWVKINPYRRSETACSRAWKDGWANGEAALRELLSAKGNSAAYVHGFHSGWHALPPENPYGEGDQPQFESQAEAGNTWRSGYEAGAEANARGMAA
jgi:hypothetical protein